MNSIGKKQSQLATGLKKLTQRAKMTYKNLSQKNSKKLGLHSLENIPKKATKF